MSYLLLKLIPEVRVQLLHFLLQPVTFSHLLVLLFYLFIFLLLELNPFRLHHILDCLGKQRNLQILRSLLSKVLFFFFPQHPRMFPEKSIHLIIVFSSFFHLCQLFDMLVKPLKGYLVLKVIFNLGEGVLSDLFLNLLISNSTLVRTVLCLEYPFCPRFIDILAILRVCLHDETLRTLGALHPEHEYLCAVEIPHPGFDGVESNTLGHHVLASLTANMKRSLISHFAASDPLSFNHDERFLICNVTLFGHELRRIEIFRSVVPVSSCSSQRAHLLLCKYSTSPQVQMQKQSVYVKCPKRQIKTQSLNLNSFSGS